MWVLLWVLKNWIALLLSCSCLAEVYYQSSSLWCRDTVMCVISIGRHCYVIIVCVSGPLASVVMSSLCVSCPLAGVVMSSLYVCQVRWLVLLCYCMCVRSIGRCCYVIIVCVRSIGWCCWCQVEATTWPHLYPVCLAVEMACRWASSPVLAVLPISGASEI